MSKQNPGGSFRPEGNFLELEGPSVRRYIWVSQFLCQCEVLDIGCGHGYGSNYLAQEVASSVKGIDVDQTAIQYAKEHYHLPNLEFEKSDLTSANTWESKFDAAVSFEVIEHVSNACSFLKSVAQVLRPGGSFFISTPNRRYTEQFHLFGRYTNPYHLKEYYPSELQEIFSEHFNIVSSFVEYATGDLDYQAIRYNRRFSIAVILPRSIRRIIKEFPNRSGVPVVDAWVKLFGGPPREKTNNNYLEYRIEQVANTEDIGERFPVQLYWLKTKT